MLCSAFRDVFCNPAGKNDGTENSTRDRSAVEDLGVTRDFQIRLLGLLTPLLSCDAQKLVNNSCLWKKGLHDNQVKEALTPIIDTLHSKKKERTESALITCCITTIQGFAC